MRRIAVMGVPGGWSTDRLADAVQALTGFRLVVDPGQVTCDLAAGRVLCQGTDLTGLDGLVVKKLGPAYSPGLLDRLDFLRFLAGRGVRVFPRPASIARLLSRLTGTVALTLAGVPMPPTVITEEPAEAAAAVARLGPCVFKPLFTSKARGMVVLAPGPGLLEKIRAFQAAGNQVIYLQQMLKRLDKDLGVVFLGGRYLTTYARVKTGDAWNTTTASGGRYQGYEPPPEVLAVAEKARAIFGLDFTCVDVAETEGGPLVFEVSAFCGFRGLAEGCGIDAARLYAEHLLRELEHG